MKSDGHVECRVSAEEAERDDRTEGDQDEGRAAGTGEAAREHGRRVPTAVGSHPGYYTKTTKVDVSVIFVFFVAWIFVLFGLHLRALRGFEPPKQLGPVRRPEAGARVPPVTRPIPLPA